MGARDYDMTSFAVHNQENAQVSPDPFPREKVESGARLGAQWDTEGGVDHRFVYIASDYTCRQRINLLQPKVQD